jgi:hypothetical protein
MTSLKLFYLRGASAALLLGLIVGAPDIAQAQQLWSHFQPPPRTSPATQPIITPRTSSGSSVAEDNAIVKVAEDCGIGNFRDEYGHCRHWVWRSTGSPGRSLPAGQAFCALGKSQRRTLHPELLGSLPF